MLFDRNGKPYCSHCEEIMSKEYEKVIEYIKQNPNAMVIDIIADTGVSLKSINIFVEEGYVSYKETDKEVDSYELAKKLQKVIDRGKFHIISRNDK